MLVLVTLGLVAATVAVRPGASLARQASGSTRTKTTEGKVIERERRTYGGTCGFTLWRPRADPRAYDRGGMPAIRVAWAYDLRPDQIAAS